jgi:hypothetical protein
MRSIESTKSEKMGRIEKFQKELRNTIYEVLYVLLKEEDAGPWKIALMRMIDFFQLMVFPFSGDAQFPWRAGNLFESLQRIVEVFQIITYLTSFPWGTYLAIFYLGILLVLLVILDLGYVLYSMARKKFAFVWPLKAPSSFCSIFVTILFLPLLSTQLSPDLSCRALCVDDLLSSSGK